MGCDLEYLRFAYSNLHIPNTTAQEYFSFPSYFALAPNSF